MAVTAQAACWMCLPCCCGRRAAFMWKIWNVHLAVYQHGPTAGFCSRCTSDLTLLGVLYSPSIGDEVRMLQK